ncbi:MAG TPA: hypothetical protein VGC65_06015 [Bacteroidia bacterium]
MIKSKIPYRLILAVMAGIAVSKALAVLAHWALQVAGVFPPLHEPMFETRLVIISLVLHSVFAIISAIITAMIAREQANKAVFILGTKEAIFWLVGVALLWNHAPFWVNITKAVLGPPLAWIGGKIYKLYKGRVKSIA